MGEFSRSIPGHTNVVLAAAVTSVTGVTDSVGKPVAMRGKGGSVDDLSVTVWGPTSRPTPLGQVICVFSSERMIVRCGVASALPDLFHLLNMLMMHSRPTPGCGHPGALTLLCD